MSDRARRWGRRVWRITWVSAGVVVVLAVLLLLVSRDARFVVRAGWEEALILLARQDLAALAEDPATRMEERARFQLVLDVRAFAAESLDLDAGRTFTRFSRLRRDTLVLVLSASPRDQLVAYAWWFPIVGRVPYRGYFDLDAAEAAEARFEERGYDTYVRPAAAFSTLGWFEDPLLSTALRRGPVSLAELVIHEITHNTVWVPGEAAFNESLASFVGFRGAEAYFRSREDTASAARAAAVWRDEIRLGQLNARLVVELEAVYASGIALDAMLERRAAVFDGARERYHGTLFEVYDGARLAEEPLNNATVVATRTYRLGLEAFDAMLDRFDGNLPVAVHALGDALEHRADQNPFDIVEALQPS